MNDKQKIPPYSYGYAKSTYEKLEKYEMSTTIPFIKEDEVLIVRLDGKGLTSRFKDNNELFLSNFHLAMRRILENIKKYCSFVDFAYSFKDEISFLINKDIIQNNKDYANRIEKVLALPKVKDEKENTNRIEKICKFASRLQDQCLRKYGILLRGSIVEGSLYINDDFVYGSGLIKAYELENSEAIYPRIVIDDALKGISYISASSHTVFKEEIWDNHYFINFLNYYHPLINTKDDRKNGLIKIIEQIDKQIKESAASGSRVLQKLFWLKQFIKYLQDNNQCIMV